MATPEPDVAMRAVTAHVVCVTGAAPLDGAAVASLNHDTFIIAADGGLDHALAAGLTPDVLVGDLDSVSPSARAWAESNATVVMHPTDKAHTDTELAIADAVARQPLRLTLLAGAGDRLDHTIAAIGALGAPITAGVARVDGWWGSQELHLVRPGRVVAVRRPPGTTFSVLSLHGPCRGVTITGATWPLVDADVGSVVGLGVSNTVADGDVHVSVADGVLTVIVQPDRPPTLTTPTLTPTWETSS